MIHHSYRHHLQHPQASHSASLKARGDSVQHLFDILNTAHKCAGVDLDYFFFGQNRIVPIEIKEKTAANAGQPDAYFGLDVNPFVKLCLFLSSGEPLFVVRLDADRREVVVGPRAMLLAHVVRLREVNWLGDGPLEAEREALARVRSTRRPVPALVRPADGGATVTLLDPEEGVAPGQACVLYAPEGSRVLGGGWIAAAA